MGEEKLALSQYNGDFLFNLSVATPGHLKDTEKQIERKRPEDMSWPRRAELPGAGLSVRQPGPGAPLGCSRGVSQARDLRDETEANAARAGSGRLQAPHRKQPCPRVYVAPAGCLWSPHLSRALRPRQLPAP